MSSISKNREITWVTRVLVGVAVFLAPLAVVYVLTHLAMPQLRRPVPASDPYAQLRLADPALVKYREVRAIATGLAQPHAIALGPGGLLYVAGDARIVCYRHDVWRTVVTLTGAPYCLALAPGGAIYVGLRDHVEVYRADGTLQARWGSLGKSAYLTSIAATRNAVWVADAGSRAVVRYDANGHVVQRIGKRDDAKGVPGFVVPSPHLDVAVARDGTLWASNPGRHELESFNGDGTLRKAWGTAGNTAAGFSGCCNPTDFAQLPDGRMVTAEKKPPRVKIYGKDGAFAGFVAGPEHFSAKSEGLDLAVDRQQILVLDAESKTVRVFAPLEKNNHE